MARRAPQHPTGSLSENAPWSEIDAHRRSVDLDAHSPAELERFADAAFWCSRTDDEVELRQLAFAGFVAAGEPPRAAYAAWLLSVRHGIRGQTEIAAGWVQRARRELEGQPRCVEVGFVACGEAEVALGSGALDEAYDHAARAVEIGREFGDSRLVALALVWQGLTRLAAHEIDVGVRFMDEAMTSVMAGELDPFYTGWIYCFAIDVCMGVADLRRAGTWSTHAWRWATSLSEPTPYLGLCRVHQVQLMGLQGELTVAEGEARRACDEMLSFEPKLAGEAFYVTGEILRRRGDLQAAELAFSRARDLGRDPQPGMALVRLTEGDLRAAAGALRTADPFRPPLQRAELLSARVEVALAADQLDEAQAACHELEQLAEEVPSDALRAAADTACGRVRLAGADAEAALPALRTAARSWRALELACEVAQTRALLGLAMRQLGDDDGATQELESARSTFERLGAVTDARRVAELLGESAPCDHPLSPRECEVLGLVAAGCTNRQIAERLIISEHTVARHLSNIYTKLDVGSRTEAAAYAFANQLA